jgi:uncharacterized protein (TIGR00369 family)
MQALTRLRSAATDEELQALLDSIPYVLFLGVKARRQGDELTYVLEYSERLIGNPILPALHGGAIGAFLETAALLQLLWESGSASLPKTINVQIEYLRSGRPEDTFARAKVKKQGRRVAYVTVEAWQNERARPIATGTGNFLMPGEQAEKGETEESR